MSVRVRQANSKLEITEGKGVLADVVQMLVAWERSLEERWQVRIANTVLVHLLAHTDLPCTIKGSGAALNPHILRKTHAYREAFAKRFNYDTHAMMEYIRKKYADYPNHVDLSEQARRKRAACVAEERASYGKQD